MKISAETFTACVGREPEKDDLLRCNAPYGWDEIRNMPMFLEGESQCETFLYRDHRGGLDASMETMQVMVNLKQLATHVASIYDFGGEGKISIEKYGKGQDHRIDWDTHLVMYDCAPAGFTNKSVWEVDLKNKSAKHD